MDLTRMPPSLPTPHERLCTVNEGTESSAAPDISVVMLGFACADLLPAALDRLRTHRSRRSFEVVVVANGATDEVRAVISATPWIRVVWSRANRGFAGGCNLGAAHARAPWLLFLNDDALVEHGWLDGLANVLDRHPEVGAVGSVVVDEHGEVLEAGCAVGWDGEVWPPDRGRPLDAVRLAGPRRVSYASGCSLLMRREAFDAVGGFDEAYHPAYYEDVDVSAKLWCAGWEVWVTPASVVTHAESSSTTSPVRLALHRRNGGLFRSRWVDRYRPAGRVPVLAPGDELPAAPLDHVLFVDDRVPVSGLGSGFPRTRQNLVALARAGAWVLFHPRLPGPPIDAELEAEGIASLPDLRRLEAVDRLDTVVISRPHNLPALDEVMLTHPDALFVYDAEARFSARLESQLAVLGDAPAASRVRVELRSMLELERLLARRADAIATISDEEADWFRAAGARRVTVVTPFPDRIPLRPSGFADRSGAVFVSAWLAGLDSPNADGLRWLATAVLPKIDRGAPDVRVAVTGEGVPPALLRLRSSRLHFVGTVADLDALHLRSRLAVVPVRYGAGVKLKVIDALVTATPVVTTSVGADGIPWNWRRHLHVVDDPAGFAEAMERLLTDRAHWERVHEALLDECRSHRADVVAEWRNLLDRARSRRTRREGTDVPVHHS